MAKVVRKKKKKKVGRKKLTKLNEQQKKFCRFYVEFNDLGKAWLKAGYNCKSKNVASTNAVEFIRKNPYAVTYIAKLRKKLEEKTDKTAEDVIKELVKIGFSNIQDYITKDNRVVDLSEIPREDAAAIASVETDVRHDSGKDEEGYTEKVKFKCHNKEAALKELLNRFLGLAKQRVEHSGVVGTREMSEKEVREYLQDKRVPCDDAIAE